MNSGPQVQVVAVVCQAAEDSVTHLCEQCGVAPARNRFCSGKCRQAAYRKSPAHAGNLAKLRTARAARRIDHYQRKHRACALGPVRGYGGPLTPGVPQLSELKLSNYMAEAQ